MWFGFGSGVLHSHHDDSRFAGGTEPLPPGAFLLPASHNNTGVSDDATGILLTALWRGEMNSATPQNELLELVCSESDLREAFCSPSSRQRLFSALQTVGYDRRGLLMPAGDRAHQQAAAIVSGFFTHEEILCWSMLVVFILV